MPNNQLQPFNNQFILYQDDNGITNINVRFDGKDVWFTQQRIQLITKNNRSND
jgi:hypothetical protein